VHRGLWQAPRERAVRLSSVVAVIAAAFVVLASSMLLLVTIAAITSAPIPAPIRPDDAAGQPSYCERKKCCCDSAC
jgi:hypothetical protein